MSDLEPLTSTRSPRTRTRMLSAIIFAGAVLAGGGAYVFAGRYDRPGPAPTAPMPGVTVAAGAIALAPDAPAWNVIRVARPTPAAPRWTDPVPARIVFDESATSRIGSPLAGRVTAVLVERGQRVRAGAPLYTIASSGLAELRAEQSKADIERKAAHTNLERAQALVDAGAAPAKDLVAAREAAAEAEVTAQLAATKLASLKVVNADQAAFTVVAPRDGVIVEKDVEVGQQVDAGSASLIAVADLAQVWVVADRFQGDVGGLAPGAPARVLLDGSTTLTGTVDQVSAVVDPERHTVPVRVRLANPAGALRPNAYAQVQFLDATVAAAVLPAAAVLSDGVHSYVYVLGSGGQMQRRDVTVAAVDGGQVPVLSGVAVGEQVVTAGAILLDNQIQLDSD
jgi:RND family efflux transporter MFP subunit